MVVDITNPVNTETSDRLATPPGTSAEEVAQLVPEGTAVVKAFNTTFAGTLVAGEAAGQQLEVLGHSSAAVTDRYLRRQGAGEAVAFARARTWAGV